MSRFNPKVSNLPDIITFAEAEEFCGKASFANSGLFPRQKTILRMIYLDRENMTAYDEDTINHWSESFYVGEDRIGVVPDIWQRIEWLRENGYPHFREVLFVGGRRAGKGVLGGVIGAYQSWKLIKLGNPQRHYGIERGKDLYMYVAATNQTQARDYQFADIASTILSARCFEPYISSARGSYITLRTPADLDRIADFHKRGQVIDREMASVRVVAISSNARAARGGASFALALDEFAHMLSTGASGPLTAEEVYKALIPSLGEVKKDALIFEPSSPYSKAGKAYEVYEDGLKSNPDGSPTFPDMLVLQLPTWSPYENWDDLEATEGRVFISAPEIYDDHMKLEEKRDPETFKVERRAQWAEVINAYLMPKMVDKMFDPIVHPDGSTRVLSQIDKGILHWVYRGHADPSKSGANFALAIGHAEDMIGEDGESWSHVFIDHLKVWRPEDYIDHQIPYDDIEWEIAEIIANFRSLKVFSYDQYGSFVTVPRLRRELNRRGRGDVRVREVTHTESSNQVRWERFKSALGLEWLHAFKDSFGPDGASLLELELKFLQSVNGKVLEQRIGPVRTKDLADACSVVVSELLADQLERVERRGRLAQPRVAVGAPGGYHSGSMPREEGNGGSPARQRLDSWRSDQQASRRGYGVRPSRARPGNRRGL